MALNKALPVGLVEKFVYNITKNQYNPIKTVGRDSFLSPKTPKNTTFLGVTQGSHNPYILGDTTRPRHITYVLVWSKSDQRRLRKTLHNKQTDRQTDRQTNIHYENNGHMAVNQQFTGVHLQTPRCPSCQSASGPRDWIRQKPDVSQTPGNGADGHRHDHESVAAMTLFLPPQHGCWPSCHWFALHLQASKQIPENNTTIT